MTSMSQHYPTMTTSWHQAEAQSQVAPSPGASYHLHHMSATPQQHNQQLQIALGDQADHHEHHEQHATSSSSSYSMLDTNLTTESLSPTVANSSNGATQPSNPYEASATASTSSTSNHVTSSQQQSNSIDEKPRLNSQPSSMCHHHRQQQQHQEYDYTAASTQVIAPHQTSPVVLGGGSSYAHQQTFSQQLNGAWPAAAQSTSPLVASTSPAVNTTNRFHATASSPHLPSNLAMGAVGQQSAAGHSLSPYSPNGYPNHHHAQHHQQQPSSLMTAASTRSPQLQGHHHLSTGVQHHQQQHSQEVSQYQAQYVPHYQPLAHHHHHHQQSHGGAVQLMQSQTMQLNSPVPSEDMYPGSTVLQHHAHSAVAPLPQLQTHQQQHLHQPQSHHHLQHHQTSQQHHHPHHHQPLPLNHHHHHHLQQQQHTPLVQSQAVPYGQIHHTNQQQMRANLTPVYSNTFGQSSASYSANGRHHQLASSHYASPALQGSTGSVKKYHHHHHQHQQSPSSLALVNKSSAGEPLATNHNNTATQVHPTPPPPPSSSSASSVLSSAIVTSPSHIAQPSSSSSSTSSSMTNSQYDSSRRESTSSSGFNNGGGCTDAIGLGDQMTGLRHKIDSSQLDAKGLQKERASVISTSDDIMKESQISQLHQQCVALLDGQQQLVAAATASMNSPTNSDNNNNGTSDATNNLNSSANSNLNSTSNGNSTTTSASRSKRLRTSFKHNQLKEMKRWFSKNQNPDAKDLKTLAQTTGLSKRVLQVWFQNARAKFRRNNAKAASQQIYDANQHTSHILQLQQQHQQTYLHHIHHHQQTYQHHQARPQNLVGEKQQPPETLDKSG